MKINKKIFKKWKILFSYILSIPIYWISYLFPKDKNLWIFGSWFGNKFADNSKYLFLYIKKKYPVKRIIWLSNNMDVIKELKKDENEVCKNYSLKGFLYSMRASCVIVCTGLGDVNRFAIAGSKKIELWHGTPLKKIGYDNTYFARKKLQENKFKKYILNCIPFLNIKADLVISTSEESKKKIMSAFKLEDNNVVITGQPRNDVLFSSTKCSYIDKIKRNINFKYIFTYIPTCRGIGYVDTDLFTKYNFDIRLMQNALEKLNGILIIKPHHYNTFKNKMNVSFNNRIFISSDQELPDIYPLIKQVDVLITDYSSIYFDFLLLNRPIIFAPFDFEEYIRTTDEFYYNYNEVTPGPKSKNWDDVIKYMYESINEPEKYKKQRETINALFNFYNDGKSSERVYNEIMNILK